jgi:ribosomal protein S18 acetylase RimI-like enzyme
MPEIIPYNENFEDMVEFITRLNNNGAHHIGYFGVDEADIRQTLLELEPPIARTFQLAVEDGRIIGVLGAEADPEIGRAWLFGPLIEHTDWQAIADRLYETLKPAIPAGIHEHELFCDMRNLKVQEFAARHGFPLRSENAILVLEKSDFVIPEISDQPATKYSDLFFEQFNELHSSLFPNTYYNARQIIEKQNEKTRLFIATNADILQGYVFCKAESETGQGYLDFIGVAQQFQGQGIGKCLMATALGWMFSVPGIEKVAETVNTNNITALRLYNQFGFVSERSMRGYRLKF